MDPKNGLKDDDPSFIDKGTKKQSNQSN